MRVDVRGRTVGTVSVVAVTGEIDLGTSSRVREAVDEQLRAGSGRLVLDLGQVTFMDSTGLGLIVGAYKSTSARGGGLRLVCDNPRLLRLLTVTGLSRSVVIRPTVQEALSDWVVAAT
jgi:anti-sigma B factor antagonist